MADVVINSKINNAEIEKTVNNFARLKSELKQAKSELLQFEAGSEGFAKVQSRVSQLKDKLDGLNDSTKIQGTGVERLTQSFNLLTESFSTGDIDKAKLAFTGLGQAMKAIPIFLLIEGVRLLIDNFDEVVKFFGDFTGIVNQNQVAIKNLTLQIEEQKGQTDLLKASIEAEIIVMEAQGVSTELILKKKKELLDVQVREIEQSIALNKLKLQEAKTLVTNADLTQSVINQTLVFLGITETAYRRNAELQIDRKKRELEIANNIAASEATLLELKAKFQSDEIKLRKEGQKEREKIQDDEIKRKQDAQARDAQVTNDLIDLEEKQYKDALKRQNEAAEQARIENLDAKARAVDAEEKYFRNLDEQNYKKNEATNKARRAKEEQDLKASENAKLQARKVGLDAAQGLSQAFFQSQINGAKGNAVAELKIRKQMFEVDKAFNVARAIQDGIRAVQAALTIPPPGGQILAVANGALAAANVAKILSTQFDGGAQNIDVPNVSLPTGGGGQTPNTFQPPTFVQQSTQLDDNGNPINQPIQAVVAETQVTSVQDRVSRLYRQSRI